jgi:hypothetical protein
MSKKLRQDYNTHYNAIGNQIELLQTRLEEHRIQFHNNGTDNWNYLGDLKHVRSELSKLLKFMRG